MTQNPVLVQAVIEARVDELRRAGSSAGRRRRRGRERAAVEGIMRRAGWLLVGVGLRLVASGSAADRALVRGQR